MSLITHPLRVPCTGENCPNDNISTLHFINEETDQKCKKCAELALGHAYVLIKYVHNNAYEVNPRHISDQAIKELIDTRIKIMKIDKSSVITEVFKLAVWDPIYETKIFTTSFFRSDYFERDGN